MSPQRLAELESEAIHLPSYDLTFRQVWDLELLLNGAFAPLLGYATREDFESICDRMRLRDGTLWPIPITLDVGEELGDSLAPGDRLALRHPEGMVLALLAVRDVWRPDKEEEAQKVFGTTDDAHPGVFELLHRSHPVYLGGPVEGLELSPHHTFRHLRHTPAESKAEFARRGWQRIVAFQTRNPLHKAHVELTRRAASQIEGKLFLHPVVGRTSSGDVDYFTRVRCYQAVLDRMPPGLAMLSLLPLAMRMAGPREALWHALIRRNYGCTHFIVGRDHAGPSSRDQKSFYGPYEAQELVAKHEEEAGIRIVPFEEMVYCESRAHYAPRSEVAKDERILTLSGTELRRLLQDGSEVPDWFSYPEVIRELRLRYPDRSRQGFTVFFTGLSGAGKSTIANILMTKLLETGSRPVTLLDGDIVRKNLSSELGFSKEHRDLNIRRIGFVASEITKNRGVAICAPIAPYRIVRREVRDLIDRVGGFIEVFVATPIEVCEERDRKGLYAKARAGQLKGFTGIDDPYEAPENPELVVDTTGIGPEEAAHQVLEYLVKERYMPPQPKSEKP